MSIDADYETFVNRSELDTTLVAFDRFHPIGRIGNPEAAAPTPPRTGLSKFSPCRSEILLRFAFFRSDLGEAT
jgi:hypothetical protein